MVKNTVMEVNSGKYSNTIKSVYMCIFSYNFILRYLCIDNVLYTNKVYSKLFSLNSNQP